MPRDLTEHVEIEVAYDAVENCTHAIEICKRRRVTSACVDEPFRSEGHSLSHDRLTHQSYSPEIDACGRMEGAIGSRNRDSVGVPSVSGPR